jgi:integrase
MESKSFYSEIQDTQVDVLEWPFRWQYIHARDVDVHRVETELNAYTRVQQVPLDTDPLMWLKQHVQEFPRLPRMARRHLTVPATFASPERLFSSVGLVKSDLWGRFLDTTLIHVMWVKQAPWTQLEREQLEWHTHTHTPRHTHTYHCVTHTHLSLSLTPWPTSIYIVTCTLTWPHTLPKLTDYQYSLISQASLSMVGW